MFGNEVLDRAADDVKALLQPHLRPVSLKTGQLLLQAGKAPEAAYFPTTALLSGVRSTSGGHTVATDMIGRFEAAGLLCALSESRAPSDVVVQIAGEALVLPASALRASALAHPDLLTHFLAAAASASTRADLKIACDLTHDTHQRLCCWLLEAIDRRPYNRLELTQQALATALGVQRTTVNASAMALKQARIIRYSRGGIDVIDRPALRARSCGCHDQLERTSALPVRSAEAA
jgi:CRP-like cAMP-binding protein